MSLPASAGLSVISNGNRPVESAAKKELRKRMRALRGRIEPDDRDRYSLSLCRRILERGDVASAMAGRGTFAVYLASPEEIDLSALIAELHSRGCRIAVPAWSAAEKTYELLELRPGGCLVEGPHGILEPCREGARKIPMSEPAVWIVPGLAFTPAGDRLGYGGGWYDRFLRQSSDGAVSLGAAYPFQVVERLPREIHDIRLSGIVVV